MTHRVYMVDVFAEQPYSGNPLAVVAGKEFLPDDTMQQIAAETNFSETTFVLTVPEDNGGYRVRVFTPSQEIAFAGHPILGTAWVVQQYLVTEPGAEVRLNLVVGQVPVQFESSASGSELAWFIAPPMTLGATAFPDPVTKALGLIRKDIDTSAPIQVVSAGTSAMIVPLSSLDALRRSQLNLEAFAPLVAEGFPPLVYLFCRQTHQPDNDLCVRFFFEAHGVREDPATGNGAAFLGAYLLEHEIFSESDLNLRIEQGYEVRRPSLVMLRTGIRNGVSKVSVGGHVIPTLQGELL